MQAYKLVIGFAAYLLLTHTRTGSLRDYLVQMMLGGEDTRADLPLVSWRSHHWAE